MLGGDPALVPQLGADGLHLDSRTLAGTRERPLPGQYLVAVSGHTLEALQRGEALGADFAVLSPILATSAHPDLEPLGWEGFAAIAARLDIPVYALGGVGAGDEYEAIHAGGQGMAGHRGYWRA